MLNKHQIFSYKIAKQIDFFCCYTKGFKMGATVFKSLTSVKEPKAVTTFNKPAASCWLAFHKLATSLLKANFTSTLWFVLYLRKHGFLFLKIILVLLFNWFFFQCKLFMLYIWLFNIIFISFSSFFSFWALFFSGCLLDLNQQRW